MLAAHRFLLVRTPDLYFHLRNVGRRVVGTRRHQRALFAELVGPGDLVFDVGANIGEFTGAFRDLGARVVSVEPQPRLTAHLRRRFRRDGAVTVVQTALSDRAGEATLYCTTADALATLEQDRTRARPAPVPSSSGLAGSPCRCGRSTSWSPCTAGRRWSRSTSRATSPASSGG